MDIDHNDSDQSWLARRGDMRCLKSRPSPPSSHGLAVQAHHDVLSSCSSDISARSGFLVQKSLRNIAMIMIPLVGLEG